MQRTPSFEELFPQPYCPTIAESLLREWAAWWYDSDEAPAKMPAPGVLHVRTAIYFQGRKDNEGK